MEGRLEVLLWVKCRLQGAESRLAEDASIGSLALSVQSMGKPWSVASEQMKTCTPEKSKRRLPDRAELDLPQTPCRTPGPHSREEAICPCNQLCQRLVRGRGYPGGARTRGSGGGPQKILTGEVKQARSRGTFLLHGAEGLPPRNAVTHCGQPSA